MMIMLPKPGNSCVFVTVLILFAAVDWIKCQGIYQFPFLYRPDGLPFVKTWRVHVVIEASSEYTFTKWSACS